MKTLFSRPDIRLLIAGQTLSMFGDWAMIIVLGICAKVLTGSNSAAGLVVLAATAVAGLGIVWAIVALATAYQRRSPSHVQGRVSAAANMLFSVPQTISIAAGAALITFVDYRVEIVAMAVVFVLAGAYLLTRRDEAIEAEPALA
jgi:hypothetical protein